MSNILKVLYFNEHLKSIIVYVDKYGWAFYMIAMLKNKDGLLRYDCLCCQVWIAHNMIILTSMDDS